MTSKPQPFRYTEKFKRCAHTIGKDAGQAPPRGERVSCPAGASNEGHRGNESGEDVE